MFKLRTAIIASLLCLSFAALADDKPHSVLKQHPNLLAAEKDLHSATKSITKSQEANECVFKLEGGHGEKAKEAVVAAEHATWEAAEWVSTHDSDCGDWRKKNGKGKGEKANLPELKGHPALKGHANMIAAEKDLIDAYKAIGRSQEANECVFGIEGGHGQAAKEAIDAAFKQMNEAAEWVDSHAADCKK